MAKRSINSKRKGKTGELEAARELERLFGCVARRGVQYCGGQQSPDIVSSIPGVSFEVKRTERLSLYPAVEQAVRDAGESIPVVLHRANGKPWLAIVLLDDLSWLVEKIKQ